MAFFRLFALVFRHFAWRISFFRLFAWRYFVFSLFRLAFFRYFVFSLGVISSRRRAITPGEKTKERNNEMAQTSHQHKQATILTPCNKIDKPLYSNAPVFVTQLWLENVKFILRYTVGDYLTSSITTLFVGWRTALCSLQSSNSSRIKLQKCIRMGITIFKNII